MKKGLTNVGFIIVDIFKTSRGTLKFHENKTCNTKECPAGEIELYGKRYDIFDEDNKVANMYEMLNGDEEGEMLQMIAYDEMEELESLRDQVEELEANMPDWVSGDLYGAQNSDLQLSEAIIDLWSKRNRLTYSEVEEIKNFINTL